MSMPRWLQGLLPVVLTGVLGGWTWVQAADPAIQIADDQPATSFCGDKGYGRHADPANPQCFYFCYTQQAGAGGGMGNLAGSHTCCGEGQEFVLSALGSGPCGPSQLPQTGGLPGELGGKFHLPHAPSPAPDLALPRKPINWDPLYLRCSKDAYLDYAGHVWLPMLNSSRAKATPFVIAEYPMLVIRAADSLDELYRGECFNELGINVTIPVRNDTRYEVTLYWAETMVNKAGARVFDVVINDDVAWKVDAFALAGGPNTAYVSSHTIPPVAGGVLDIHLSPRTFAPKFNAISVTALPDDIIAAGPVGTQLGDPLGPSTTPTLIDTLSHNPGPSEGPQPPNPTLPDPPIPTLHLRDQQTLETAPPAPTGVSHLEGQQTLGTAPPDLQLTENARQLNPLQPRLTNPADPQTLPGTFPTSSSGVALRQGAIGPEVRLEPVSESFHASVETLGHVIDPQNPETTSDLPQNIYIPGAGQSGLADPPKPDKRQRQSTSMQPPRAEAAASDHPSSPSGEPGIGVVDTAAAAASGNLSSPSGGPGLGVVDTAESAAFGSPSSPSWGPGIGVVDVGGPQARAWAAAVREAAVANVEGAVPFPEALVGYNFNWQERLRFAPGRGSGKVEIFPALDMSFQGAGLPDRPLRRSAAAGGPAPAPAPDVRAVSAEGRGDGGIPLFKPKGDSELPHLPISSVNQLSGMNDRQLFSIFTQGTAEIPSALPAEKGKFAICNRTNTLLPNSLGTRPPGLENMTFPGTDDAFNLLQRVWNGKVLYTDPESGNTTLWNLLLDQATVAVTGEVSTMSPGISGDGKPSVLIDYGRSDILAARMIRDEMRRVGPSVWLGRAFFYNPAQSYLPAQGPVTQPLVTLLSPLTNAATNVLNAVNSVVNATTPNPILNPPKDYLPLSLYFAVDCQSFYAPKLHYFPLMGEPLAMVQRATGFQAPLYRVPDLTGGLAVDPNSVSIPHQGADAQPGGVEPFLLWPWDLTNPNVNGLGTLEGFLSLPASWFARIFGTSWAPSRAARGGWDAAFPPDQEGLPQDVASIPEYLATRGGAANPASGPVAVPVTPPTEIPQGGAGGGVGVTPVAGVGGGTGGGTSAAAQRLRGTPLPLGPAAGPSLSTQVGEVADAVTNMANNVRASAPAVLQTVLGLGRAAPGGDPLLQGIASALLPRGHPANTPPVTPTQPAAGNPA